MAGERLYVFTLHIYWLTGWQQVWFVAGGGGGTQQCYVIVSRLNGLALDVQGGNRNPGAQVVTWNKSGSENQLWYDDLATGTIRSKLNGLCLDIEGKSDSITELELLHACHLFSQARTQISYRPITLYSVDLLLFTSGRGRHFDLSPLAVQWVTTRLFSSPKWLRWVSALD